MILEGFEIENWACIKHVLVSGLPPTGTIVFHGPNGTGKSSIIEALRACLMDFPSTSTSKELKRWFPKNGLEKPRVAVTFNARGSSWRITKHFGSRESRLESRTAAGTWKLERSTAADAHEEVRKLLGDKDSHAGLHQLLWLTQAEFQLPDPRKFDSDLQLSSRRTWCASDAVGRPVSRSCEGRMVPVVRLAQQARRKTKAQEGLPA